MKINYIILLSFIILSSCVFQNEASKKCKEGMPSESRVRYSSFKAVENAMCISETQTSSCKNRIVTWSGSGFAYETCEQTRIKYASDKVSTPNSCQSEIQKQLCSDGLCSSVWTPNNYTYSSCSVVNNISCENTPHGSYKTRIMYLDSMVDESTECKYQFQSSVCDNGTFGNWDGIYQNFSCTKSRTRYSTSSVASGQTCAFEIQKLICSNGNCANWSPNNYSYTSCNPVAISNRAPNGTISAPTTSTLNIVQGTTVSFSGSGTDLDGDSISCIWNFGTNSGILSSASCNAGAKVFNNPGTYLVTLTVKDSKGLADASPASISIVVAASIIYNLSPYYFIAIHNEPGPEFIILDFIKTLKRMVAKADEYNIKLTLMFTPQYAKYLSGEEILKWKQSGHEIAAHHHSIYHNAWDGYTNLPRFMWKDTYTAAAIPADRLFLGDLDDFMAELKTMDQDMISGCLNEETDKRVMTDQIIYNACSGYSTQYKNKGNYIVSPTEIGINEFILKAKVNGIERKWLNHAKITTRNGLEGILPIVSTLENSKVFGTISHSISSVDNEGNSQEGLFYEYLAKLHQLDPNAIKSKTMREIIEERLLPEEEVQIDIIKPTN